MYRRVYRQEGGGIGSGLSELNAQAFMRKYVDKYVQDYNQRNKGEVAAKVIPRPVYASMRKNNNLNLDSDLTNQAGRLATNYIKPPTKIPTDKGLTTLFHGTPYKESVMKEGFKSPKVFTTTDPKRALDYAKEGKLRGTPFGKVTGDVLETKVPTSQVESLLKRGLTRTPEVVLSPEEATKIFQGGGGDILGSPSLLTKIGKTVGRVAGPVGTGLSIADAITRYKAGDYGGAVLSTLSAIPGFGIPATVAQLGTDYLGITGNKDNNQEQLITREQFEQTLPEGYKPLNSTYDAYFDTPYDERVETRKGSYSGMPIILTPENANYFQTYFQGPTSQLHTRPEDRVNAFQSVATPISMQNKQQGLPSLMKIVNEQRNPTPVDPDAPYGYVEYTPPFYGGMMIPPGGNKPYMVPADKDGNPVNPKGIFRATL